MLTILLGYNTIKPGGVSMKFSTQGRYGLKLMHYLAFNECGEPISLAKISEDLNLSRNYMEQLIQRLRQAGLVTSTRGAYGGYQLSRPSNEITIGQILRAMDEITLTDCALDPGACSQFDYCECHFIWKQIQQALDTKADNLYLSNMLEIDEIKEEA